MRIWQRYGWSILLGLSVVLIGSWSLGKAQSFETGALPQAQYIVALSDVDMVGTAYEDGLLGSVVARPDTLSLFRPGQEEAFSTVAASNSVFSPPSVLDISPDGRFAAVVETLQPRPEGATTLAELEAVPGDLLQIFDLRDPAAPSLISSTAVSVRPSAVHFNHRGDLLAIVGLAADNGLTLVPFDQGMLGEPQTFSLGLVTRDDIPFDPVHNVRFHPSQDLLAVNLTLRNQVIFFQVDRSPEGSVTGIQQWGNIVAVNRFPSVGKFTPDGRYYITSDLMWGPEVPRFYGYQGQGTPTTIAVGLPSTATDVVQNQLVAVTPGGFQSETLAISEDGTLLALSNLRTTGLPRDSDLFDPNASVSLYRVDLSSGALTKLDEVTFEALLPQGLAFDPSGQQLYVGVNEYFDGEATSSEGGVEVWEIVDRSHLERTNQRYRAPRGVHVVQTLS